jgi:hypothetical protein
MPKKGPNEKKFSDPVDQIALVLRAIKDPQERANLLFDPHRYAANNRIRLDPGFTEALRTEVARLNQSLVDTEDKSGITLPRIDDPRIESLPSFTVRPGEVAILPAIAVIAAEVSAVAAVVEAAALVVIAVTEVYQATKFRTTSQVEL